jgi:hypothetical protein
MILVEEKTKVTSSFWQVMTDKALKNNHMLLLK